MLRVVAAMLVALGSAARNAAVEETPTWQWGGDLRARTEYFDNLLTLASSAPGHEQSYQRYRARLWGAVNPIPAVTATARLTWESWDWNRDSYKAPYCRGWVTSEGIFDLLNCTWKKPGGLPLDVSVGRQEITLGDGWLVAEGTPLDGSRTTFFDAIRATLRCAERTTVEFVYLDITAKNHRLGGALNDKNLPLAEQDERAGIVYLTHRASPQTQLDLYWIFRDLTRVLPNGDDGHYSTIGARVAAEPAKAWLLKAESAFEFGTKNSRDLRAWGFLGQVDWSAGDTAHSRYRFTLEALSGDRPGTSTDEQFDPLWGRYPRWSETTIMLFVPETHVAQLGNLVRAGPGWSGDLSKTCNLSVDYSAVWALENNRASSAWFGAGRFRGHFGRAVLKSRLTPRCTAALLSEVFAPGGYYAATRQDTAVFLRAELAYRF